VLFLVYVAIIALTRFLAIDIKDLSVARVLVVTGSTFVLTLAVLAVQIAASRFATAPEDGTEKADASAGRARIRKY
jgi:phosphate starvation-inducible membrane PsiE